VLAFRCDECGNVDEHLWEIVHDHACTLAGTPEEQGTHATADSNTDG